MSSADSSPRPDSSSTALRKWEKIFYFLKNVRNCQLLSTGHTRHVYLNSWPYPRESRRVLWGEKSPCPQWFMWFLVLVHTPFLQVDGTDLTFSSTTCLFVYFFVSAGVWSGGPLTFCLSISLWRLSKSFAAGNAFICFCCLYSTMIPKGIVIWEIEDNKLITAACLCDKLTCSVLLCRWQKGLSSQQKIKWRKMMQNINF